MDTRNSAPALPPGTKLFGYEIAETLGSGAFGIVYRATLLEIDGTVAIKEFLPAQLARRRADGRIEPRPDQVDAFQWSLKQFRKEARTLHALANPEPHPNIIKVELVFEANDTVYFSMRWEEGRPLDRIITPDQRWPEAKLRKLLLALLDGLERVHKVQVLHRDIKPSNLLVRPDGSPVLIDFGAARRNLGDTTASRFVVLTPGFAPPEQATGEYGPFTDIYGLAASLFFVLTGDQPIAFGKQRRYLAQDLAGAYSQDLLTALDRALEPDHRQRPRSVVEWRQLLLASAATMPTIITPRGASVRAPSVSADSLATMIGSRVDPARGGGDETVQRSGDTASSQSSQRVRGLLVGLGALATVIAVAAGFWIWQPWAARPDEADADGLNGETDSQTLPAPTQRTAEIGTAPGIAPAQAQRQAEQTPRPTPGAANPLAPTQPAAGQAGVQADKSAADTPADVELAPKPPALPPAKESIAAAIGTLDCARIKLTKAGERSFRLAGHVGTRNTLLTLRDALRRIPSIRVDISGIEVLSAPVCATLHALRPYASAHAPTIRPNHADGRYRIGDPFAVEVENSDQRSGRLHLFFISAADEVMVFPTSFGRLLYKGTVVREDGFDIGGPVGADLILAVWCRGGAELPRALAQTSASGDFLPRLRAAMDAPTATGACSASSAVIHVAD